MEQKKILWVIVSMSAFVLIIFGIALYLYAPFRNKSTRTAPEMTDLGTIQRSDTENAVDPVKWSRDPDSIPPLESETPASVNVVNNFTVVNGETVTSKTDNSSVDVQDLTETSDEQRVGSLPENLAKTIGVDQTKPAEEKEVKTKEPKKTVSGVSDKKGSLAIKTQPKPETKKTTVKKTNPKVNTAKKTVETIYWVQTASLSSRLNAENARDTLAERHMNVEIFTKETTSGTTYRVRVGPFKNKTEAEYWLKKVKAIKGFEGSYITQDRKKA